MKRKVAVVVDEARQLLWDEGGTIVLSDSVRPAYQALQPGMLVEVEGEYERPSRHVKLLHVHQPPTVVATARERVVRGWRDKELLRRVLPFIEEVDSVVACLRAVLAVHDGNLAEAEKLLVQTLSTRLDDEASEPLAFVFETLGKPSLGETQHANWLHHVWQTSWATFSWPWKNLVHPVVLGANTFLPDDAIVEYPWHFGGPRIEPHRSELTLWLERHFDELAHPEERIELAELRSLDQAGLRDWLQRQERRDDQSRDDAYQRVLAAHPDDSEDSPPDDAGDVFQERDQIPATWARHRLDMAEGEPRWDVGGDLVRIHRQRTDHSRARSFVVNLDAAALLSAIAPEQVHRFRQVRYVDARLDEARVVASLDGGQWLLLMAAEGQWTVFAGTLTDLCNRLPEALRADVGTLEPEGARERTSSATVRRFRRALESPLEAYFDVTKGKPKPAPKPEVTVRRVKHAKFGTGVVTGSAVEGGRTKLTVEFEGVGTKTVLEGFVEDVSD